MTNITAIIIDDERNNCENLSHLLEEYCPEVEVLCFCYNAAEAFKQIEKRKPNLLFLDIEMPGGSGLDLLQQFPNPDFAVIFVTAFDQYAIKALRLSAIDYLLKPIHILELQSAVARAKTEIEKRELSNQCVENYRQNGSLEGQNKQIALPTADRIVFVKIKEIIRCEAEVNYTHVITSNGEKFIVSKTLREYDQLLEVDGFIRPHQSHLVNKIHIKTFEKRDGGYLKISNGDTVPVSRQRKETVLKKLKGSL